MYLLALTKNYRDVNTIESNNNRKKKYEHLIRRNETSSEKHLDTNKKNTYEKNKNKIDFHW